MRKVSRLTLKVVTVFFYTCLVAISIALSYLLGNVTASDFDVIYEVPPEHIYHTSWREEWQPLPAKVIKAAVVADNADALYVYIDTVYKGSYGPAGACGAITTKNPNDNAYWECSPVSIKPGAHSSVMRYTLSQDAPDKICSSGFSIVMKNEAGHVFYVCWQEPS